MNPFFFQVCNKMLGRIVSNLGKPATTTIVGRIVEASPSGLSSGAAVTTALLRRTMSSDNPAYSYETLSVKTAAPFVTHVELNRPDKRNAMNKAFWREIRDCFRTLNEDADVRAVVLSGAGPTFTSGLDISDMSDFFDTINSDGDLVRKAKRFYKFIRDYQDSFTALEKCHKPIIAAVHGGCIGGGVDMVSSSDIRYCTQDAFFQIKEVDLGLAADVGTLQRLPKIVGNDSLVRELAYSARIFASDEAKSIGFIGRVFPDKATMMDAALAMATLIAEKSPVAVQGTKVNLNYSRDHTADESLEYMAQWNSARLQSEDLVKAVTAMMSKEKPTFSKL